MRRKKTNLTLKKKGKYFNCDKKNYFAREYRLTKTNIAKPEKQREKKKKKAQRGF
jgi:hypothetical protein